LLDRLVSPPLFTCQRAPARRPTNNLPIARWALRQTPNHTRSEPARQEKGKGEGLATTDCPTQLPTQYRRRGGVSRPCSGRERVVPPRGDTRPTGPCRCRAVGRRGDPVGRASCMRAGDEPSAISTAWLNASPHVHLPPINQVVYLGPYSVDRMGTLIFRRASRLDAFSGYPCRTSATQRCPWRDNWYTGGPSVPVLSY
jgi:hypothetical protein